MRTLLQNEATSLATLSSIMHLDHANIVTEDLDRTTWFFTEVLGLSKGPRPDFQVPGHWLHIDGRPLIHLTQATLALPSKLISEAHKALAKEKLCLA